MKLPDSHSPSPPAPTGGSTAQSETNTERLTAARQQLDQLRLADKHPVLARVTEVVTNKQGQPEQLILDVRGRSLLVQASLGDTAIESGDLLKLMRSGDELQLIGKLAQAADSKIAQALAQRLPWQQRLDSGLAQLLAALSQGIRTDTSAIGGKAQPLPGGVQQAIESLLSLVPKSGALAPGGAPDTAQHARVKQWLTESGLFAESRLARAPEAAIADIKLAIGRIITTLLASQSATADKFNSFIPLASHELVQAPLQFPNTLSPPASVMSHEPVTTGQLLRLMAGMLNRLTVNQLHSQVLSARTSGDGPAPTTWLFDLPWLSPQTEPRLAQIRLEHDDASETQASSGRAKIAEWRLTLAMEPDTTGPLFFEITLRQETVSSRVWAEKQSTLRRINDELPALRKSLNDLGLEVVDLDCRKGSPQSARTQLEHRLVDTKA